MVPPNISLLPSTMSSMDSLPDSLLVQILSRLDDSADVARCRVASKAFDHIFPYLRSINLVSTSKWYNSSKSRVSNSSSANIKPFEEVFLHLISKQEIVESVSIRINDSIFHRLNHENDSDDLDFIKEWLPRVSESLKSLSLSIPAISYNNRPRPNVLPLISVYCHNLVNLKLESTKLSMDNMNTMPMLTNLTLAFTILEDEHLNQLNKCFPNLKVLDLMGVTGLEHPKIHHLNLQTFHFAALNNVSFFTLTTPNLVTLGIECRKLTTLHVEAPMLSRFHLGVKVQIHAGALNFKNIENLKTLWLECCYINSLLSEFPVIETLENLTLDSGYHAPKDTKDSKLTLQKVFTVFPNVCYLCLKLRDWSEFEACLNPEGSENLDGWKRLNTICLYLPFVDPSISFSSVARVLDQCVGLSTVSLLIESGVCGSVPYGSEKLISKCMARWPGLKWRWGKWNEDREDTWITDSSSIETPEII